MFAWNPFEGGSSCSHTQHREGREIYWISGRAASIYSQSIAPRLKIRKCQKILLKVEKLTNPRVLLSVPNLWSESERSQQCVGVFKHLFNCWHCRGDIQLHKRWDVEGISRSQLANVQLWHHKRLFKHTYGPDSADSAPSFDLTIGIYILRGGHRSRSSHVTHDSSLSPATIMTIAPGIHPTSSNIFRCPTIS